MVLWRVVKRLSYVEDARCLKVKGVKLYIDTCTLLLGLYSLFYGELYLKLS